MHRSSNAPLLVSDVIYFMDELAPPAFAESWDKSGLQLGSADRAVHRVLISLDADHTAVQMAIRETCDLILCHHPLFFNSLKDLVLDRPETQDCADLIRHRITVFAAHTNLDACVGGVNEALADALDVIPQRTLLPFTHLDTSASAHRGTIQAGWIRICDLRQPMAFRDWCRDLRERLGFVSAFFSGTSDRPIKRIAISGGAFSEDWIPVLAAHAGEIDAVVSGEIKHHVLAMLEARGIRALALGHELTERPVLSVLEQRLSHAFPDLEIRVNQGLDYRSIWD